MERARHLFELGEAARFSPLVRFENRPIDDRGLDRAVNDLVESLFDIMGRADFGKELLRAPALGSSGAIDEQTQISFSGIRDRERLLLETGEILGRIILARYHRDDQIWRARFLARHEKRFEMGILFGRPGKFVPLKEPKLELALG